MPSRHGSQDPAPPLHPNTTCKTPQPQHGTNTTTAISPSHRSMARKTPLICHNPPQHRAQDPRHTTANPPPHRPNMAHKISTPDPTTRPKMPHKTPPPPSPCPGAVRRTSPPADSPHAAAQWHARPHGVHPLY
ncbi:hypothetical protein EDB84DRAFT_1566367 [Lactarius hengduanensis]|nr:hypothetical protein EDB84DRAFT_1566367 [Lactarius hengduanensis]